MRLSQWFTLIAVLVAGRAPAAPWIAGPVDTMPATSLPEASFHHSVSGPGGFLVVWTSLAPGGTDLYGARVAPAAGPTTPFPISTATGNQQDPAAAVTGNHFVVVWDDDRNQNTVNIYGARVSFDGGVLEPAGILISGGPNAQKFVPFPACSPAECLVVWSERVMDWNIMGTRVRFDLSPVSGDYFINKGPAGQFTPIVVAVDGGYFTAWSDDRNGPLLDYRYYASGLDADGGPFDPLGVEASPLASSIYDRSGLADDGSRRWLAFSSLTDAGRVVTVGAFNPGGGLTNSSQFGLPSTNGLGRTSLTFDGTRLWLAFEVFELDAGVSVQGLRLFVDGGLEDPAPLVMMANASNPVLSSDQKGTVLLTAVRSPGALQYQFFSSDNDAGVDAGVADGGRDAGTMDAGTIDAGTMDAGTSPRRLVVGCGCATAGPAPWILLLALSWLNRRRRSRPGFEPNPT